MLQPNIQLKLLIFNNDTTDTTNLHVYIQEFIFYI